MLESVQSAPYHYCSEKSSAGALTVFEILVLCRESLAAPLCQSLQMKDRCRSVGLAAILLHGLHRKNCHLATAPADDKSRGAGCPLQAQKTLRLVYRLQILDLARQNWIAAVVEGEGECSEELA